MLYVVEYRGATRNGSGGILKGKKASKQRVIKTEKRWMVKNLFAGEIPSAAEE